MEHRSTSYTRGATTEKAADGGVTARGVVISSETRDSYGDIVRAGGAVLDDYRRNPVVLFGHDMGTAPLSVVGRGENVRLGKTPEGVPAVLADIVFAQSSEFAREVGGLWSEGMLHATSIGFTDDGPDSVRVIDPNGTPVPDADTFFRPPGYGLEFLRWRLREFSIVPVPANPDAVRHVRALVEKHAPHVRVGAMISAANKRRIKAAMEAMMTAHGALQELMDMAEPKPEEVENAAGIPLVELVSRAAARLKESSHG